MKFLFRTPLVLAALLIGCQSADSRLLVAENALTAAQDGWAELLERGVVTDSTSVRVGTAALNHANAAVSRAYAAHKQPSTMGADGRPIDALSFWLEDAERAVKTAVATYQQIRTEKSK